MEKRLKERYVKFYLLLIILQKGYILIKLMRKIKLKNIKIKKDKVNIKCFIFFNFIFFRKICYLKKILIFHKKILNK